MNFPSRARLLLRQSLLGLGGSTFIHAACAAAVIASLLAWPHVWHFEIRRGEVVVLQAQMASVAATQPVEVREVEVSIEPVPLEPPTPVAVDNAPVTDTLEPIPAVIPVVRTGEIESTDTPPQQQPPESPAKFEQESKIRPQEVAEKKEPDLEVAPKVLERQVAEVVRDTPNKISVAAAAPKEAGAQVDEMPRKMANNREPYYPLEALRAGLEGRVVLRVKIAKNGKAEDIAVETSSGFDNFDESAISAVRDWEFSPARRNGYAVAHEVLIPVRFRIRRG